MPMILTGPEGIYLVSADQQYKAALFAYTRSLIDWDARNPYYGGCSQATLSVNAGTKRVCPPTDYAHLPTA